MKMICPKAKECCQFKFKIDNWPGWTICPNDGEIEVGGKFYCKEHIARGRQKVRAEIGGSESMKPYCEEEPFNQPEGCLSGFCGSCAYQPKPTCVEVPEPQPIQDEVKERLIEIIASALSDNDVRPRADELLSYLSSQGYGDTKQAHRAGMMEAVKWFMTHGYSGGSIGYVDGFKARFDPDWKEFISFLHKNLTPEQLKELGVK